MADPSQGSKPLRVLLSEGSSTSAREAITVLGLAGHIVEVCDPSAACLGRFSRFVSKFHRCPGLRDDPAGYLSFVEKLLSEQAFDVLLPIHEQGFVFARVKGRFESRVGLALPVFESYRAAHSKSGFSRLLGELGLPQPVTRIVTSPSELRDAVRFPCVVKTSIGTASRAIWFVRDDIGLTQALRDLGARDAFAGEVLVQDLVAGATEKAQAIFSHGKLLGFHAYRQIAAGAGGGEAIKQSVRRPKLRADLATIGERLGWHGALSVDIIMPDEGTHLFIDCNPRLVESMSAYLAGLDLVDLLLRVSQGKTPEPAPDSREGVRTHLAMQALLGRAARNGTRREVFRECVRVVARRGPYAGSVEELTPLRHDWISAVPLAMTALALLADPKLAGTLSKKGWGAHLLGAESIRLIEHENFP
ncbi:ATP-grasp domain-containing protein [Bradyrhizobium sp.]|uniref:ATP-grasp domain-containing protein n=1 Tax=Bradyrhizobium sp. TaxID=376 RepID=UPI002E03FE77|nr:ATP-grasp domain-containing protein [Bradyrhizobium sp.]